MPMVAEQDKTDLLTRLETILFDVLKRDGLAGRRLPAEQIVLLIYERAFRTIHERPLEMKDLPLELKRIRANYLDSVERGHFHRR